MWGVVVKSHTVPKAGERIARRKSLFTPGPPTRQASSGMLSDLRNQIPAAVALLTATMATACSSELTCTETATCPPDSVDARIDRHASDVDDAGSHDVAADISVDQDDADRVDRHDGANVVDASKE